MSRPLLLDLFHQNVVIRDGCWGWNGRRHSLGYGCIYLAGRQFYAHRIAYELERGPIPDGLEIDHLCSNPECCNPAHLEAVTHSENIRRIQDRQTSCRKAGHDWTDPRNVYVRRSNGHRYCAECARIAAREAWRVASLAS